MDPFTHALVGSTCSSFSNRNIKVAKYALFCGLAGAMAPDLDILIRSSDNPLLALRFHRHFTHSIFFAPFGALLVAAFLWIFLKTKLPFCHIYLFTFVGMFSHGFLDSLTNYGTHLLWPFTMRRESWNLISIIDPIFTFTLLGFLIAYMKSKKRQFLIYSMCFALSYWTLGYVQHTRATNAILQLASSRGHQIERMEVKPSFANLVVWRSQYQSGDDIYIDAVHSSPWAGIKVYEGSNIKLHKKPDHMSPIHSQDYDYFAFFSDGWISSAPDHPLEVSDVRFALLPNQAEFLWAIQLNPGEPEKHLKFINTRPRSKANKMDLWRMIQGVDIESAER